MEEIRRPKVGDTVWIAYADWTGLRRECPVCCGTKEVVVAPVDQRPGVAWKHPCRFCSGAIGSSPTGIVEDRWQFVPRVSRKCVGAIQHTETSEGVKVEVRVDLTNCSWTTLTDGTWFWSEEEAKKKAVEIAATANRKVELELVQKLIRDTRDYSWYVGCGESNERQAARNRALVLSYVNKALGA